MTTSREQMASALVSLGYEVFRNWKVKLRKEEKTESGLINMDGSVHDYGSGFHGDLISVLQNFHGMKNFKEAKEEAERLLGQEIKIDFTEFDKTPTGEAIDSPLPDSFMLPHRIDAKNNRQPYLHEVKQLFMGTYNNEDVLAADWENILKVLDEYDVQYNKKSGRLIMPIRDIDGSIKTFWKYKKRGEDFIKDDGNVIKHRKVLYTKNRICPPFAIKDLQKYKDAPITPVLVCEGEKDSLIARANGLNSISIGGAGKSAKLPEKYLELFRGLKVIIAGDYDKAGVAFNTKLLEQLKPYAESVTVLRWEDKAKEDGFELFEKFDIADYFAWKHNHKKNKKIYIQRIETVEVEIQEDAEVVDLDLEELFHKAENKTLVYKVK